MAEQLLKRLREETQMGEKENEDGKRHKSYNHILSLLDHEEKEEETTEDLSSVITNLQQEISDQETHPSCSFPCSSSETNLSEDQEELAEEEGRGVMRLLLEASDDELGIPNTEFLVNEKDGDEFGLNVAFWEMEDEVANYNILLQSELFML